MTCTACHAPTDSTYLCHRCTSELRTTLERIPDALATVQDTVARMDRVGTGSTRGGTSSRPPVNLDAMEHKTHLAEVVHSWARLVLEDETRDDLHNVEPATYLRMSLDRIVTMDVAGEMLEELREAVLKVQRASDLPPEMLDLGACDATLDDGTTCDGRMRARKGDHAARCTLCGWTAPVQEWQALRISEAWTALAPLSKVCAALDHTAFPVKLRRAQEWVKSGHLIPRHRDPRDGTALYTVAEVDQARRTAPKRGRPRRVA